MKKSQLTLLALLACMLLFGGLITYLPASSAVVEEEAPSVEKFVNIEKGYSIEYPKDWIKQDIPRLDLVLISPSKLADTASHASMNLVSESIGNTMTLDQFYNESIKHLTSELKEAKIEKSGELKINNVASKWTQYNHKMIDTNFSVLQYFLIANGNIYLMTFSSTEDDFDHYKPTFESIANSFKLLAVNKDVLK